MSSSEHHSRNIYVASLPLSYKDEDLQKLFSKFGKIISAKVIDDPDTGMGKGYGFVLYEKESCAQKAIQEMIGHTINGQRLQVRRAKITKEQKTAVRKDFKEKEKEGEKVTPESELDPGFLSSVDTDFMDEPPEVVRASSGKALRPPKAVAPPPPADAPTTPSQQQQQRQRSEREDRSAQNSSEGSNGPLFASAVVTQPLSPNGQAQPPVNVIFIPRPPNNNPTIYLQMPDPKDGPNAQPVVMNVQPMSAAAPPSPSQVQHHQPQPQQQPQQLHPIHHPQQQHVQFVTPDGHFLYAAPGQQLNFGPQILAAPQNAQAFVSSTHSHSSQGTNDQSKLVQPWFTKPQGGQQMFVSTDSSFTTSS